MSHISFKTKLTESEFIKFQFLNSYRKFSLIFISFVGLGFFVNGVIQLISTDNANNPLVSVAIGCFISILLPLSIYRSSKKIFRSNKTLQEPLKYELSEHQLKVEGTSFNSSISLQNIHHFKEMKRWILFYHSSNTFNLIPKSALTTEDLIFIRNLFKK